MESNDVERERHADFHRELRLLSQKYTHSLGLAIERLTENKEWFKSWLFVDLREWERTERLQFGLENIKLERILPSRDRILKLREKLTDLQTQTVSSSLYSFYIQNGVVIVVPIFSLFGDFWNA